MANVVSRFIQKTSLQKLSAVIDLLPGRPIEIGVYYIVQSVGIPQKLPTQFNVAVREAGEADIEIIADCIDKREQFSTRFHDGEKCILALDHNRVAGFIWFNVKEVFEQLTQFRRPIADNVIYIYDLYVDPKQRGKGVSRQIYTVLCNWMACHGKDTMLGLIAHDNIVSLNLHASLGFVPLERIWYLRIFGFRFYRVRVVTAR